MTYFDLLHSRFPTMWLAVLCSFVAHLIILFSVTSLIRPTPSNIDTVVRFSLVALQTAPVARAKAEAHKKSKYMDASLRWHDKEVISAGITTQPIFEGTPNIASPAQLASSAQPLQIIEPAFTARAVQNDVEGDVVLDLLVNKNGHVEDVVVVERLGYGLDEEAVSAIMRSTFEPARDNDGNAIIDHVVYRYKFRFLQN